MALCFFFGHEVKPDLAAETTAPPGSILNVTHAALAQSIAKGDVVRLFVKVKNEFEEKEMDKFCVGVLTGGERESISLNLNFGSVETVQFTTEGARVPVHITGYYNVHDLDDDGEEDSDDEDVEDADMEDDEEDNEEEKKKFFAMLDAMSPEEREAYFKTLEEENDDSEDEDEDEKEESEDEDEDDEEALEKLEALLESMSPKERAAFLKEHGIEIEDGDESEDEEPAKQDKKQKKQKTSGNKRKETAESAQSQRKRKKKRR